MRDTWQADDKAYAFLLECCMPAGKEAGVQALATDLREMLKSVADERFGISVGFGRGSAHLSLMVGGDHYTVTVETDDAYGRTVDLAEMGQNFVCLLEMGKARLREDQEAEL